MQKGVFKSAAWLWVNDPVNVGQSWDKRRSIMGRILAQCKKCRGGVRIMKKVVAIWAGIWYNVWR